ncbi:MAG: NADH:flavin oxidoreductase [Dehalococcoidales bacterium]|nr:NADH:flavin oxidoreductase [Dehalococcoidales bacterium]
MSNKLFTPIKIKNIELPNRTMRSATWDATADEYGAVTNESVKIYRDLGKGNIGLIVTGHAYVSHPLGQATPRQYGIYSDEMIPGLKKLVNAVHHGGDSKIAVQIAHAGINSGYLIEKGFKPLAVSSLPESKRPHHEMTEQDIQTTIKDFINAAVRAREAGFDAVQLHAAHGYLMSQFISPIYNNRSDEWGGDPDRRRQFHIEVVKGIRKAVGNDYPLFMKFGLMDDREGGMSLAQGIEVAQLLVALGVDFIEVSGGVGNVATYIKPGDIDRPVFRERAAALKRAVKVRVAAVNGIRSPQMAKEIIDSGDVDVISFSRPFIREPQFLSRWMNGDKNPASCISCNRCFPIVGRGEIMECGEDRRIREEAKAAK